VGEGTFSAGFAELLAWWLPAGSAHSAGSVLSFFVITSLFILFADLLPRA
jgi:CBS domain containing-hemolysin-like protein